MANSFLESVWFTKIVQSVIILIVHIAIYKFIIYLINKSEKKAKTKLFTSNKGKTYLKLLKSIIRSVFIVLTILVLLQTNGININSVLAGVGIFGVVFGLAIQDWLKDIIRGTTIISDEYFEVGDVIKYKDMEGKVLVIGLKSTKVQDLITGNIISIANRNIEEVQVVSRFIYIRVPTPYETTVEDAEKAMNDIVEKVKKNDNVENCTYKGLTELAESSVDYLIEVECNPQVKNQVRRDTLKTIFMTLSKHHIEVPYTQIDIHNK